MLCARRYNESYRFLRKRSKCYRNPSVKISYLEFIKTLLKINMEMDILVADNIYRARE